MSNRYMYKETYSLEPSRVEVFAQVAIGATGAPTLSAANSRGVASITRNSAGNYSLTLQDVYNRFFNLKVNFKNSTGIPAAPDVGVKTETVSTTKIINFVCSAAGVATDPASGDTMYIRLHLKNSSA